MGGIDDLVNQGKDLYAQNKDKIGEFLKSEQAEDISDKVLDGASDLVVQAMGDAGKHARSALGVAALRGNVPVVVDAIFELSR